MNLSQKYQVERIISQIVTCNKSKSLNELKRMIKSQIRLEVGPEIASEVGIDEIIEVITSKKLLKTENVEKTIKNTVEKNKQNESYEEVEER